MSCEKCGSITLFSGEDGKSVLNGTGAPGAGLGNNGDFYIDTSTWEIYGPKTAGAWGSGTSLVGAAGSQGNYGGWSSEWLYDGSSTASGTSAGDFRFNNGTLNLVTTLYINDTNTDSANMQAFLDAWNNSGAFGLVRISKKDDANVFWMGAVTAESDTGSEHDITVTHVVSNGTFTDNDACVISFVESGSDGTNGIDAYDSGWTTIGAHNGTFGLPAITNWTSPQLRVIGRHVYIQGRLLIPLATSGAPGTLLTDAAVYHNTYNGEVQVYTGASGGYTLNANGSIQMIDSAIPTDLQPTQTVYIRSHQIISRVLKATGTANFNLLTILPSIEFRTDGTLFANTWKDLLDSAGELTDVENTPIHTLIMRVTSGERAINFGNYNHQFVAGARTYEIVDAGSGYTNGTHTGVTSTTLSGAGAGAQFTVVIASGKIMSVTQTAAGSGYVDGEFIQLDDTSGTPGIGTGTDKVVLRLDEPTWQDDRVVSASGHTYPVTFDGMDETHLGGFIIPFTFSYPLGDSVTEAQIQAAIASM